MFKLLAFILTFPTLINAQNDVIPNYVPLAETKVYDIEIIIFAYNNHALPNKQTYNNPKIFDYSEALALQQLTNNPQLIKNQTNDSADEFSMQISDKDNHKQALVWFEHNSKDFKLSEVWKKLKNKDSITPLLHRAWRQPETPFETPKYIQVNTIDETQNNNSLNDLFADFAISGMVSLSKGRFLHFGHKLNLFRQYNNQNETKNMVFTLTQRKQISLDELHYYDSPWFGSIVKITEITGETNNEN